MSDNESDLPTNPNTPRSSNAVYPEEVRPEIHPAAEEPELSSFKSTTTSSRGSDHDLHPTWPSSIDIKDIPAVASWGSVDEGSSLEPMSLNIHWQLRSNVAFFTIRTSSTRRVRRYRSHGGRAVFYIFVYPERIRELSLDTCPPTRPFGDKSLLLRFVLDKPLAVVTPMMVDENARELMESCRRLASQTSFQLHVDIFGKGINVDQLQKLCSAACGAGLSSSDRHARIETLYHGQGGRLVEGESLEAPPVYSEPADPAPVVVSSSSKSNKRTRLDSPSPEPYPSDFTKSPALEAMRALLDRSLDTFKHQLRQELRDELKQDFDASLAAHNTQVADSLAAHKQDVADMLQQTEARIITAVRREFGQQLDGIEESLVERVSQEVAEAKESIMQELTEQELTATLTFTHHPVY